MTVIERHFVATADDLFAVLVDPETYPAWLVGTKQIRQVDEAWPEPGSSFRHTVGFGPIKLADRTTVCSIEEPKMLELFVRARPLIEAVVRFEVTPAPDGCLLRMTETPTGLYKVVSPATQPLIRARNERSLGRLANAMVLRSSSSSG